MLEETVKASGACLCGKVSFKANLKTSAGACHCGMCRKWCGGPLMSVHTAGAVRFTGGEYISTFSSSSWAERGFCKLCGTGLYYRLLPQPAMPEGEYILSAGIVSDQSWIKFDHEVYVDHGPDWYRFADEEKRTRLTEVDIMAMYGASGD